MKNTMILSLLLCLLTGCSQLTVDNTPIAELDLNRYLGDWYEVARFDHRFERGMEQTKANYALREDGKVAVTNTGLKNGKLKTARGKAKLTDTPALLRVSFFGPFYGDYRVMLLDPDYQYALIGSGSDKYLWILSRTPQLTNKAKALLLKEAQRRRYDTSKLIWVKQN
ncbi:MAG: lipocalin family protein [Bacteroidaceae bacterium]|nr:lipocalin family protein [Bacteroidaceae bacterium]